MSLLPEINQASAEINKFVAQANIHQTIAPVYPAAFTDPADTMLLASRDPVIREVSVGMTGEGYSDYSVSGTPPLSLPNSLGKPLKAWSVDVLPKQDLNGYDAPWPAGGGANQWDEEWEVGTISGADGQNESADNRIRSKNYIPVEYNTRYRIVGTMDLFYYDANKAYIGNVTGASNITFTTIENSAFIRFRLPTTYGTTYNHDIAINFPATVTSYSPYSNICPIHGTDKLNLFVEESYDQSVTPKAVITLPQTVYTGTIGSEGGESRWGEVDLGALTWTYQTGFGRFLADGLIQSVKPPADSSSTTGALCSSYKYMSLNQLGVSTINTACAFSYTGYLYVKDPNYSDPDVFKNAVSGVKLVYELANPTTFAVPTPPIPTPSGTATTWATAEDGTVDGMEVTYIKSE